MFDKKHEDLVAKYSKILISVKGLIETYFHV